MTLTLMVGVTSLRSQQSTLDSLQKAAEKLTAEKIYSDVKEGFTNLVSNLQGPAKHVYYIYVYQHKAEGITFLFLPIVLLLIASYLLYRYWKEADWSDGNRAAFATALGIACFLAFISCSVAFFAGNYFTKIINPEYFAIQDIVKAFK